VHTASPPPELVTLHLWGVAGRHVPWALSRMALHRKLLRPVDVPGLRFAKLLGTGHGHRFTPTDADPRHWALIASWDTARHAAAFESGRLVSSWDARSVESWRLQLRPLTSHGRWSGATPFGAPEAQTGATPDLVEAGSNMAGPCAILTRARLAPSKMITFWRAVPPVAAELAGAKGLRFARGIGEAPIGLQATFSVWDDLDAAASFAYRSPAHLQVIERTIETRWYAEQLFARFAVIDSRGMVDGHDPLGMRNGAGG
jgi:hypothetical protein